MIEQYEDDEIWDDESGTPSPLTAADVDARLEANNERMRLDLIALEQVNIELERLIGQRADLLERLTSHHGRFTQPHNPRRIRRIVKRIAKTA